MEFGRISESELSKIDFSLPNEPLNNLKQLQSVIPSKKKVYTGLNMWGNKQWNGLLYPSKIQDSDKLTQYAKNYNSVECDATHYKIYPPNTIANWAKKVANSHFIFCPKMYSGITHDGSLSNKQQLTQSFIESITAFGPHLGPVLIQLSPAFAPTRKNELHNYLSTLPTNLQFFVEVRHPDWFGKASVKDEFFNILKTLHIGTVITDTAGRRDCAHMQLTLPKVFIRYVGNSLHPTDYTRIDAWVTRMKYWLDNGLEELYFFIHMHDEATSPELTMYLIDKMNAVLGLHLIKPKFVEQQATLF